MQPFLICSAQRAGQNIVTSGLQPLISHSNKGVPHVKCCVNGRAVTYLMLYALPHSEKHAVLVREGGEVIGQPTHGGGRGRFL